MLSKHNITPMDSGLITYNMYIVFYIINAENSFGHISPSRKKS